MRSRAIESAISAVVFPSFLALLMIAQIVSCKLSICFNDFSRHGSEKITVDAPIIPPALTT